MTPPFPKRRLPAAVAVTAGALAISGCAAASQPASGATPKVSSAAPSPTTKPARAYPDPVAWGRQALKEHGAEGRWEFTAATIDSPGTDRAQLDVETPLYDKEENRRSGPAAGLCVMFTSYAQENGLARVVIHASNSAPLASVESTEGGGIVGPVIPAWTCHRAG